MTGAMYPRIGEIEAFLEKEGALVSRMTGSGPTVFAIFRTQDQADQAAERLTASKSAEDCAIISCKFVYRI